MSADRGTLETIAEQLVLALAPLRNSLSDLESFRAFMWRLGWDVQSLPPSYQNLVAKVDAATTALEALGPNPQLPAVVSVVEKAGDVYRAAKSVADAPVGVDPNAFFAEFGEYLFELLLVDYLAVEVPDLYSGLEMVGVIEHEFQQAAAGRPAFVRSRLRLSDIPDIVTDPGSIPQRVYGWGTQQFNAALVVQHLAELFSALELAASLDRVDDLLRAGLQPLPPNAVERPLDLQVRIALFEAEIAGVPIEAGIAILELPGEAGGLPGMIVQPFIPPAVGTGVDITDSLRLDVRAGTDLATTLGIVVRPGEVSVRFPFSSSSNIPTVTFGATLKYSPTAPRTILGQPAATRLEVAGGKIGIDLDAHGGQFEFRAFAEPTGAALVLSAGDQDSFLQKVVGQGERRIPIPIGIAWSNRTGFSFEGGAGLAFTYAPHLSLGPVTVEQLRFSIHGEKPSGRPTLVTDVAAVIDGQLGPVAFAVQGVGVQLLVVFTNGNVGPFDLAVGFRPPDGVGIEVDAVAVKGGGFLFFDNTKKQYAGVLELSLEDTIQLKVIGILNTILPGGQSGFSLLLIITAEFEPIQLGFGFTLNGVGGLAGINRTMLIDRLRAGLRNRTLESILFPPDPIENAPKIISDLSTIFPPVEGRYAFGPQLKIGWGTPTLVSAAVGIFIELPPPIRLAILAQIRIVLPTGDAALIEINMDAVGTYEQEKKRLAVDATLYDSQIVGFTLTGDMAMRLNWGDQPFFAFSVGGFNPRYSIPSGVEFPQLRRLELSMGSGGVRMNLATYFAVTSNTAQVGAHLELRVGDGAGLHGWMGFDALFVFTPFSFVVDISAGVDLLVGGEAVMTIHLNFTLSGPTPWHAWGDASIDFFFFSISVPFNVRWGSDQGVALPDVDVRTPLIAALGDTRNWTGNPPAERELAATLRAVTPPKIGATDASVILAHPFSRLTIREKLVPLGPRIDKFGNATPAKWNQFRIASGQLNTVTVTPEAIQDYFARGQFIEMSNDEKLSRPSFELLDAGAAFGSNDVRPGYSSPLEVHYETFIIDDPLLRSRRGPLYRLAESRFFAQTAVGAAGRSKVWTTGPRKYIEPDSDSTVEVLEPQYLIAGSDDLASRPDLLATSTSRLQAEQRLAEHLAQTPSDRGRLQVVPAQEAFV
jgi:hypothetical protein